MSLNLHGTRLEVQVREAVQPPELTQEEGHYHVVSKADGIVTRVETMDGEAAVKEGDTVTEGEILISGTVSMEPPMYSDQPVRYYQTHARGRWRPGPGAPSPRPSRSPPRSRRTQERKKAALP